MSPEPGGVVASRFVVVPASYVLLLREHPAGHTGHTEAGDRRQVLLQLRGDVPFMAGHWAAAAAGHVERGETAYDAAHREALEELGVTGLELEFVTAMQRTRGGESIDERIDFFFTSRVWTGEPRVMEPTKTHELRWCDLDELPDPMVPHERAVLEMLRTGHAPPYTTFGFAAS